MWHYIAHPQPQRSFVFTDMPHRYEPEKLPDQSNFVSFAYVVFLVNFAEASQSFMAPGLYIRHFQEFVFAFASSKLEGATVLLAIRLTTLFNVRVYVRFRAVSSGFRTYTLQPT